MKKLLLIIALTLLWSFSANALDLAKIKIGVVEPGTSHSGGADADFKLSSNPNCRTHYTAPEAYESTADGNVNTFSATYSTVTQRTCEGKVIRNDDFSKPIAKPGCGAGNPECIIWAQ